MAGLLDRIARRVNSSFDTKKTKSRPKTMSQVAYRKPVQVMPVSQVKKPETPTIITLEREMTTENITVENIPEEISNLKINSIAEDYAEAINHIPMSRVEEDRLEDDFLLKQIDQFRLKAQQLQNLMITKESKVQELQEIVDEREVKAKELETLLGEREKYASGITEEVAKQIDSLINKVSEKMDAIGESLGKELTDGQKINEQQAEELKDMLSELNVQLDGVKTDLSDKVHSENVKCYRNLAELLKSVELKLDGANEIEKKVSSVHKCTIAIIILSILNMLGLVGFALYEMGIIKLLFG